MQFFPNRTTFLSLGIFEIKWYAIFIMTGALLAFYFIKKETTKMGYDEDIVENGFLGTFITGIIGARLWFCMFYDPIYYLTNPLELFKIYNGGLAIQGGLMAGIIFFYFYTKHYKFHFFRFADVVMPHVLIAQCLGRWGNFINSEAHGGVVSESYFNNFPTFIKEGMNIGGQYYAPAFLYESIGTFTGWIVINFFLKKTENLKRGQAFFAYFMWYGVVRFFTEGTRTDSLMMGNIRVAQLLAILGLVIGLAGYLGAFNKWIIKDEKPVLVWDFDGTLMDTREVIIKTYEKLFNKYLGQDSFTDEIKLEVLGPSLEEIFIKYMPDLNTDKLIEEYIEINLELHKDYVNPIQDSLEVLDNLKNNGYRMAIVSTKKQPSIRFALKMYNMEKYFEFVLGEDDYEKRKPEKDGIIKVLNLMQVSQDNVIYIGDTKTDIISGKNAGVYTVAYAFEEDRKAELLTATPNYVINDLKEMEELVKMQKIFNYNNR
jgi:phosphatidylglycerol:prolipoprotein diacylglycerol transferase